MNDTENTNTLPATQPPLAIVGISALFPKAANTEEFWSNIRRGIDAITEVPASHWNPDDYFDENQKSPDMTYARRGGFLSPLPFDPLEFGISPNNLEAIDTSQLLGLVGAKRALEHAGYGAGKTFDRSRVGCILGVTGTLEMVIPLGARLGHPRWRQALKDAGVADDVAEDVVNRISQSYVPWQENSFPGLLGNVVAGRIANRLDLHGTNCVVDAACASSLSAIHLAALELWTGRSDMVVTGGIDTFNDIFMFMCFSKTPALSPSGDAKPFSDEADGTILGEGVGMLVLKRQVDAERDGDRIYAILKGIGTSSDGAGNAVYAPKAEGQIRCLNDAYRTAGVTPDTVELVEAHGTGTKVGDATEVSGLMNVYQSTGRRGAWCAVGSIKSQIGHTKAAAGAAGVIKAILALQHRVLPPTIKVNRPPAPLLTDDSPFYVNTEARPWLKPAGYPRRAAVSAFGFGGSNFHCVLEESPQRFDEPDWDGDVLVIALSAMNLNDLINDVRSKLSPLAEAEWSAVRSFAFESRSQFQTRHPQRVLFVVERNKTDFAKLVSSSLTMLERYPEKESWSTPDGAYYGRGTLAGTLGVLFPGQGSQYVGMLRELACRFPVMNDVLSEANEVYADTLGNHASDTLRLSDYIYPHPSFSAEGHQQHEAALRATQIAQPAIGAVSLGVLAVIDQFGIQPQAVAGHSYGELTALCASRRFAPRVLYRLSMLRGQLMAAAQDVDGGMLALGAPLTQIEAALKELSVDLVVANHNSPTQVVLSGRIPEIDRATALFASRNIRGKKLAVAAAFHSPMVAPASRAFRPVLDEVEFAPSRMPVYANSTATEYPSDPAAARDVLATQLARPVNFVKEIERMHSDGVRTFLEVGPGGILTGLVNSILNGRDYRAIAIDSSSGKRGGLFDLASALAQLSALGHSVRWERWDPQQAASAESGDPRRLRIPISGANYMKPRSPIPPRPLTKSATVNPAPTAVTETRPANASPVKSIVHDSSVAPATATPLPIPTIPQRPATPDEDHRTMKLTPSAVPEPIPQISVARTLDADTRETIRRTLDALQRMQLETTRLHQQFLEGQETAFKTFERLADRHLGKNGSEELTTSDHSPTRSEETAAAQANFLIGEPPRSVSRISPPASFPTPSLPPQRSDLNRPEAAPKPAPLVSPAATKPLPARAPAASTVIAPPRPATATEPVTKIAPAQVKPIPVVAPMRTPTASPAETSLGSTVLAVVSEKTGYPTEMLNLDMSLDHDLGIDSIKRVEILSALQEKVPNLPAFQPDELGSLHTLRDVVTLADARSKNATLTSPLGAARPVASTVEMAAKPLVSAPNPVAVPSDNPEVGLLGPIVLAVVSEKTGYPTEMINLEMSLDHDLGIDSIKRVEILSALQERVPDLPVFQPEELGALHTLRDVVSLAEARSTPSAGSVSGNLSGPPASIAVSPETPSAELRLGHLGPIVLEVVSEKTGYPTEMLNLEMSLDHDLGIDSIKRVEILSALQERVPNLPAFQPDELGSLHTLRDVVTLADARSAGSASVPKQIKVATPEPPQATAPIVPAAVAVPAMELGPIVLEVVSEKTGYPTEMLNLDMSLDHDLGIDSIKRVEILSALQERVPNLPAFQPEELGALHTLRDVVTLANARTGVSVPPEAKVASPALVTSEPSAAPSQLNRSIVRCVPNTTTSDRKCLGLIPGSEIWITDDGSDLSFRIAEELKQHGVKLRIIDLDQPVPAQIPDELSGLIVVAPQQGTQATTLWNAVRWLQIVGPNLRRHSQQRPTLFATISRLDGRFGFESTRPLQDPVSGGLAGLAKCAAREWPEVISRAFDISPDWSATHVPATMFVNELLHEGPVEIGITPSGSLTLETLQNSLAGLPHSRPIARGDLVVISGGARGVTAEAAFAIAQAWQPRLVILGRSPEPMPEPEWLARLITEAEIKQGLIARATAGTTPKAIASQSQQITASREIARQLHRLRSAGISVDYYSVDVRDASSVQPIMSRIQRELGPVRGIIHGAGVLADQKIEDKTKEQFDRVYETKINGLTSLLENLDPNELRVLGLFSSYTARFGRVGQTDYAIANEVLNKLACQFAIQHPHCRVAAFNWGPWDGGMVQGGLKQLFAAEGVGLIPLEAGAELLVQEFEQNTSRSVEILVLANTESIPSTPHTSASQRHPLHSSPATVPQDQAPPRSPANSSSEFEKSGDLKVVLEIELDVAKFAFLESHVLGGKGVLPVAMILEWLAHAAIHRNPGLEIRGFEDFRVYQGIRVGTHDHVLLKILAGKSVRIDDRFTTRVQIVSHANGRDVLHAGGNVVLSPSYPATPPATLNVEQNRYSVNLSAAYEQRLFHGPMFHGLTSILGCSETGIVVTARSAPNPWSWMSEPVRGSWLADPLVIDSALQAIILWSQEMRGKPCLPCAILKYQQFRRTFPKDGVRIVIRVSDAPEQLVRCDVEFIDLQGHLIARMECCESVADASLVPAFQRKQLESPA